MKREDKYPETDVFKYYNANPRRRLTDDCVIRALCTGLELDYSTVLKELVDVQMRTGYMLNTNQAIGNYLISKGWKKYRQPRKEDNTKYTGKEFCKELADNKLRYVCNIGGHHIVAIINSKILDTWDCSDGCIGNFYVKN